MRIDIILAAYVVGAFLTFGHVYNLQTAVVDCGPEVEVLDPAWIDQRACERSNSYRSAGAPAAAVPAGIIWPAYWGGRAAIEVTK